MQKLQRLSVVGLLLALTPSPTTARKPADSVLLSQVKSLTLRDGQQTSHRRVSALPQLQCVGGNAKGLYTVDSMRCKNAGAEYDAEDIQWTCQASLPPEFKLGSTEVICEGYDSPEDPFVLKGSCGVEYRLVLTEMGEEKYGRAGSSRAYTKGAGEGEGMSVGNSLFTVFFWALFIGIVGLILYSIFFGGGDGGARANLNFGRGGGGGGGGDDDDDPPPPYTPRNPKPASSHRANRSAGSSTRASSSRSANNGAWRPGFWTGTAAGAAAGYAMGNRNSNRSRYDRYGYDAQPGPSSWFGGGNRNAAPQPGPSSWFGGGGGSSSYGSSSTSPSSSRHESTGFGGTRRR